MRACLLGVNLREADFTEASFRKTDLQRKILIGANLEKANLREANLREADLEKANLREANLREADLEKANLREASLEKADLMGANLIKANLSQVRALETNFNNLTLTGACIQDWNINNETNLENVVCDYIYLKYKQEERRPSDPNKTFEPGAFTALYQKALETVDLIFIDGIDWKVFLLSLKELQDEYGQKNIGIQAIERKGSTFIVRIEVPPDTDKASIEASFWEKYNPLLEAKDKEIKLLSQQTEFYSQQTEFYSQQVEVIRKDNTRLLGIVETMMEKETSKVNMIFNAPVTGVAGNVEGNQNIFTSQNIAQASAEIQNLLIKLQNNGLTQEQAEVIVANNLATQAKSNPTFKDKLVNWGKSLGNKAAETSVSQVVRRVIKLALNLAGVILS